MASATMVGGLGLSGGSEWAYDKAAGEWRLATERAKFRLFGAGKMHALGGTWSFQGGWNVRVDTTLVPYAGFPAFAGSTLAEAKGTVEALDRLLAVGVRGDLIYFAQRFWGDEGRDERERRKQRAYEGALRRLGWFWPDRPGRVMGVLEVETLEGRVAAGAAWLAASVFPGEPGAAPWADVNCPLCGAEPGERCESRMEQEFRPGTEPYHWERGQVAHRLWERAQEASGRDPVVVPVAVREKAGQPLAARALTVEGFANLVRRGEWPCPF